MLMFNNEEFPFLSRKVALPCRIFVFRLFSPFLSPFPRGLRPRCRVNIVRFPPLRQLCPDVVCCVGMHSGNICGYVGDPWLLSQCV